jgi:hypothetical protein
MVFYKTINDHRSATEHPTYRQSNIYSAKIENLERPGQHTVEDVLNIPDIIEYLARQHTFSEESANYGY